MHNRSESGFTIVELLIVVVVIAILAAITIVSYNGIAERARNAQLLGTIDAYTKSIQLYRAQNGAFPTVNVAESGLANSACLGTATDFPASAPYSAGNCAIINSLSIKVSPTFMDDLGTVTSGLPTPSLPSIADTSNGVFIRGVLYGTSPTTTYLQYIVDGDRDCARGVKNYNLPTYPGMTVCMVYL